MYRWLAWIIRDFGAPAHTYDYGVDPSRPPLILHARRA
jgi:hypothetical protein